MATDVDTKAIIAGRFQLEPEFLDTPTGRQHDGADITTASPVVIKIAPQTAFPSPMLLDRAQRELRQLGRVTSARVMRVLGHGRTPSGELYVAFAPPPHGAQVLDEVVQHGGVLAPDRARAIVLQIGEALADAHQAGVVHRNIAPHTVYLAPDDQVLVIDFALTEVHEVKGRIVQGSPHYLSPEQAEGKSVDQRSSIYSLAAIYYYLLTGSPPVNGATIAEVLGQLGGPPPPPPSFHRPGLPPEVDRLLAKALDKSSGRRQLTLRQFLNELDELGSIAAPQGGPIAVRPYRSPTRTLVLSGEARAAISGQAHREAAAPSLAPAASLVAAAGLPSGAQRGVEAGPPGVAAGIGTGALPSVAVAGNGPLRSATAATATAESAADAAAAALDPSRFAKTLIGMPAYSGGAAVSPAALGAAFSAAPEVSAAPESAAAAHDIAAQAAVHDGPVDMGEEGATIPMPRLTEEEMMATFGLDVPLRGGAGRAGTDLAPPAEAAPPAASAPSASAARDAEADFAAQDIHRRVTGPKLHPSDLPIAERATVQLPPGAAAAALLRYAAPPAPDAAATAAGETGATQAGGLSALGALALGGTPTTQALPTEDLPVVAAAPEAAYRPEERTAVLPRVDGDESDAGRVAAQMPRLAPSTPPKAASAPAGFRETAWFKKGEIEDYLQNPVGTPTSEVQVSAEDHARLSLRGPGETGSGKNKVTPRTVLPGQQMSETELIDEMRGRSRLITYAVLTLVVLGLAGLAVYLLRG